MSHQLLFAAQVFQAEFAVISCRGWQTPTERERGFGLVGGLPSPPFLLSHAEKSVYISRTAYVVVRSMVASVLDFFKTSRQQPKENGFVTWICPGCVPVRVYSCLSQRSKRKFFRNLGKLVVSLMMAMNALF